MLAAWAFAGLVWLFLPEVRFYAIGLVAAGAVYVILSVLRRWALLRSPAALFTTYSRCGACARPFLFEELTEGGRVVCAECGAAWHHSRARAFATIAQIVDRSKWDWFSLRRFRFVHDDRGMPLPAGDVAKMVFSPPPSKAVLDYTTAWEEWRRVTRLRRWVPPTTLVATLGAVMWIRDYTHVEGVSIGTACFFATGFAALPALLVKVLFPRQREERLRRSLLKRELCPGCFCSLEGQTTEFDGRVVCQCGAAWLLPGRDAITDATQSQATGFSSMAPEHCTDCPRCGYRMRLWYPCPECGYPGNARRPVPKS